MSQSTAAPNLRSSEIAGRTVQIRLRLDNLEQNRMHGDTGSTQTFGKPLCTQNPSAEPPKNKSFVIWLAATRAQARLHAWLRKQSSPSLAPPRSPVRSK